MKKKIQIIVSVTTFLIILGGFSTLNIITRKMIFEAIREQVLMDNKSIGEEILRFLEKNFEHESEDMVEERLQNLCDEIMLPNKGFICATRDNGELIAAPGLPQGKELNLDIVTLTTQTSDQFRPFAGFVPDSVYQGTIHFENGTRTNIIASIPIGMLGIRLNIHQDNDAILLRARQAVKPLFLIGLIASIVLSVFGYFVVNWIVSGYESKIEAQNRIISRKNKEMTDSIRYARFLQSSYLPSRQGFEGLVSDFFILHRPKDIVSGDFFWVDRKDDKVYFAAIDCTGHGVPGSLLSMIAYGLLEQALHEYNNSSPSAILDFICNRFSQAAAGHTGEGNLNDGMDLALCCYDPAGKTLQYAGAQNPLWISRNGEMLIFEPSKRSIGGRSPDGESCFTNNEIKIKEGDILYLFSDGYVDQFGGPENKKFMKRRFMELLLGISDLTLSQQYEKLELTLDEWMGETEQIDDILVIGVKL